MSNTVQYSNDEFVNVITFILKLTIMFLSTTKIIKVTLLSVITGLILQYGFDFIQALEIQYEWIDIQFVLLTLFMLAQINLIFKIISDRIYDNFESLKTIIKEKDRKIHQLNKDIAELNEKLVNEKLVNEKLVNEKREMIKCL
jgi:hypothetical protein